MYRTLGLRLTIVWAVASPCCAAERGLVLLENQVLRLEFQSSPVPHLARLIHKASGLSLLVDPAPKDMFQIALAPQGNRPTTVDSYAAGKSGIQSESSPERSRVMMSWSAFPGVDLEVHVTATAVPGDPLVRWDMRVDNRTGRPLAWVRFPLIAAVPAIGDSQDDFLVLPALPGALIQNPAANWPVGYSATLTYPGNLSAQFISYQDRRAGVYLSSMDHRGYPLGFGVVKRRDSMLLFHQFRPLADGRHEWLSPYPVALGVVQGTWHHAADQYKQWALKQPWCAKTLAQRDDIPAWWKQGPLVHVCEVRTYDARRACNGSYYPKLLEHLRTLRQKVDGPIVVMLAGWENHRRWTGGDYFPIFDEKQAERVIAQLRKEGFRPFFFLSGLYYTFKNEGVDAGEIPGAERLRPYFVIDKETGQPRVFSIDESSQGGTWKRHSYEFCVGPSFTKDFFCGVIDQAHARGVDVLQMDQTVTGAGSPCYSTSHGHAPGDGLYQTQAFHELLQRMRRHGKSKTKDFVLFHEEPHEQLIPFLDGFHVREYYEKRWYRSSYGAIGIPLFCYLYHEFAIGYGGDSAGLSPANDRRLVRTHAINLVAGRTPGVAVWSSHQRVFDAHPDQIKMIRHHCRLLGTRARDFLILGKMLHPLQLDVPKLSYSFATDDRKAALQRLEEPAILTSSWQSPDGRVGHLFVNLSEAKQPLRMGLDTRNAPGWALADVAVYSSEDSLGFRPLRKAVRLPLEFSRELAPLEVVFVELDESKTQPVVK